MFGFEHGAWMAGGLGMLLLWLIPIILLLAAIKYFSGGPSARAGTAVEILDEAYARGEIKREEYLQKRADLMRNHDTGEAK